VLSTFSRFGMKLKVLALLGIVYSTVLARYCNTGREYTIAISMQICNAYAQSVRRRALLMATLILWDTTKSR
jgi:hypothetical protein